MSIPKTITKMLGLSVGSKLNLAVENNSIVLTPVTNEEPSLQELLDGSPRECFSVSEEDREWLNAKPVGREL